MTAPKPGQSWTIQNLGRLIKFGVKYMESGFLDMLTNGGIGSADTYKPAIIRFNPFVTAKSAILPNASARRVVADADESLAVGCSTKLASVDVSSETTSYHFDSDPAAFCDPEQIREKKLCQLRVPPSVYTGKMRLMVQAIYGSKRTDYTYAAESAGMDNLVLAGVSLGIATPTAGLYTAPDGSYWLIKIGANVTYQKLKISGVYQAAIDGEPLSEAYALSRLIPEPGSSPVTMSGSSLTASLSGYSGPLAYGWKFNASGDKASIVVYGSQPAMAGKIFPSGTNSSATGIKTALLTVSFGWDAVNLHPTFVSVTTVETGLHMPYGQVKTFFPVVVLGQQIMQCLVGDSSNTGVINDWVAPIYCRYSKTDVLEIVRVRNGGYSSQAADSSGLPPDRGPTGSQRQALLNVIRSGTQYPSRTTAGSHGVSINSIAFENTQTNSTGQTRYKEIEYYPNSVLTEIPISALPSGDGDYVRYHRVFDNAIGAGDPPPGRREVYVNGLSTSFSAIVIIPFGDSESVIFGYESRGDHSSVYGSLFYQFNSNSVRYFEEIWHKTAGAWSYKVGNDYPLWDGAEFILWGSYTPSGAEKDDVVERSTIKRHKTQHAAIYSPVVDTGVVVVYDDTSGSVPVGSGFPAMDLDALLSVSAINPFLNYPIEVRSSYSGAVKWSVIGSIAGKQDWPNYTYLSPVGWA